MNVHAVSGGLAAASQTVRKPQPGGPAFAEFLDQPGGPPASRGVTAGPRPATTAVVAANLAPAGNPLPPVKLAYSPQEIAAFTDDLQNRFTAAHVDTGTPIALDIASDGKITVRGDHPDKAKIERLFAEDPEFANQYRGIAQSQSMKALGMIGQRYRIDWEEADDDEERAAVQRRYEALNNRVTRMSGQLTLSGGALTSPALQMAADVTGTPAWMMG